MCGICGIYEYGRSPSVSESLIVRMRDTMTHRGPDDAGVYLSDDRRVGLGNRRLSIVDLSRAGRNPMKNEDGRIWITFNGEIYNHALLRAGLENKGHLYRSRADTESIIHLYEERGLSFVEDLDGDFAFGLWDQGAELLVLARDRVGVKPLYYTLAGGRLIFASEIKAILEHPTISPDIDEQALYHYLTFMTSPAPQTLFAGIQKLPAGCMLTCDARGDVKINRYWDALPRPLEQSMAGDEIAIAHEIRRLLKQSIEKRMMSDVPFGVFLSGGIDSTANVALMSELMDQPVQTFTVGFRDNPIHNELEESRQVAREYQTDHHELLISEQELLEFLPELIFFQDEPIADPVCVPLYYISKLVRETGTKVVQVGEGSDELFCGYNDYVLYLELYNRLWRHLAKSPAWFRKTIAAAGGKVGQTFVPRVLPKGGKAFSDLFRRLAGGEKLFWSGSFIFDELTKARLLTPAAKKRIAHDTVGELSSYSVVRSDVDRLLAAAPQADELVQMIYQELKLRLPELLLMRVDKMTMATSVEARVPYLDHKLVEFAMSIPSNLKYRNGETKYILKRALTGVISNRVLTRKKKGFGVPLKEWMRGSLGEFTTDAIMNSSLRKRELINYEFVVQLLRQHQEGRENYSFFLWTVLNLSLWYDTWIDGGQRSKAFDVKMGIQERTSATC